MKKIIIILVLFAVSISLLSCTDPDKRIKEAFSTTGVELLKELKIDHVVSEISFDGYRSAKITCVLSSNLTDNEQIYDLGVAVYGGIRDNVENYCIQNKIDFDNTKFKVEGEVTLRIGEENFIYRNELLTLPDGKKWSYEAKRDLERIETLYTDKQYTETITQSAKLSSQYPNHIQQVRALELEKLSREANREIEMQGQLSQIESAYKSKKYSTVIELAERFIRTFSSHQQATRVQELKQAAEKSEQQRVTAAFKSMQITKDEVESITWYHDKITRPSYIMPRDKLYLYIGQRSSSNVWLRVVVKYTASRWLFIRSYTINVDGTNYTIQPRYSDITRDVSHGGSILEYYDWSPSTNDIEMIKAIISSSKTIVRYKGEDRYDDIVISAEEKKALQNVLDAYKYLTTR